MKTRNSLAAVLASSLLLNGAITASVLLTPVSAAAQIRADRTVNGVRLLGEWRTATHKMIFTSLGSGRVRFRAMRLDTGEETARGDLAPSEWRMAGKISFGPAHAPTSERDVSFWMNGAEASAVLFAPGLEPALGANPNAFAFSGIAPQGPKTLPASEEKAWAGKWRTTRGLMTLEAERDHLAGSLYNGSFQNGWLAFSPGGGLAAGAWAAHGGNGDAVLQLSPDGKSFRGYYTEVTKSGDRRMEWTGERVDERTAADLERDAVLGTTGPASPAQPPAPAQTPAPVSTPRPVSLPPAPPAQQTPAAAGFESLGKYDVRVDRVVPARDAQRIDVFVTLRNATPQQLYVTSGVLQVTLEDNEGVGMQNGIVLRATDAGREQFASTPVLQPGRELKVKYSFHPNKGARPARVTLTEGDKRAEYAF